MKRPGTVCEILGISPGYLQRGLLRRKEEKTGRAQPGQILGEKETVRISLRIFGRRKEREGFMNRWQLIFLQSKVNDGPYCGDQLTSRVWDWPERTWFQERLRYHRKDQRRFPEEERTEECLQ